MINKTIDIILEIMLNQLTQHILSIKKDLISHLDYFLISLTNEIASHTIISFTMQKINRAKYIDI